MAYKFEPGESVAAEGRRIANEQIAKILRRLDADRDGETAIHDARKSLKRLKALLKLMRAGLSRKDYRREYDTVRDAGRLLSGARDFEVMPATLAALGPACGDLGKIGVGQVAGAIERARRDFEQTWDRGAAIDEAVAALAAARKRFGGIEITDDFDVLARGAGKCLAVLRQQGERALESGCDEDFHEWRKSAQLHWRHLRLLTPVWPELITARVRITRALADVLGFDHDLAVLVQFVEGVADKRLERARKGALEKAVRRRQKALREEARAYAGLLIVDDPAKFAKRLTHYRNAQERIKALKQPFAVIAANEAEE